MSTRHEQLADVLFDEFGNWRKVPEPDKRKLAILLLSETDTRLEPFAGGAGMLAFEKMYGLAEQPTADDRAIGQCFRHAILQDARIEEAFNAARRRADERKQLTDDGYDPDKSYDRYVDEVLA